MNLDVDPATQLPMEGGGLWRVAPKEAPEPAADIFGGFLSKEAQAAASIARTRETRLQADFDWRQQCAMTEFQRNQLQLQATEQMRAQQRGQWDIEAQRLNVEWQNIWRMMASPQQTQGDLARLERERDEFAWREDWAERMEARQSVANIAAPASNVVHV